MSRLHRVIVTTAVNREPPRTILDREYLVVPPLLSVLAAAEQYRSTFPAKGLPDAARFHYPKDPREPQACGIPIFPPFHMQGQQ